MVQNFIKFANFFSGRAVRVPDESHMILISKTFVFVIMQLAMQTISICDGSFQSWDNSFNYTLNDGIFGSGEPGTLILSQYSKNWDIWFGSGKDWVSKTRSSAFYVFAFSLR